MSIVLLSCLCVLMFVCVCLSVREVVWVHRGMEGNVEQGVWGCVGGLWGYTAPCRGMHGS